MGKRAQRRAHSKPIINPKPDTKLDVSVEGLTELRLEEYTNLRKLEAYSNKLKEINLRNNTQLTSLDLSFNQLSQLDLPKYLT